MDGGGCNGKTRFGPNTVRPASCRWLFVSQFGISCGRQSIASTGSTAQTPASNFRGDSSSKQGPFAHQMRRRQARARRRRVHAKQPASTDSAWTSGQVAGTRLPGVYPASDLHPSGWADDQPQQRDGSL